MIAEKWTNTSSPPSCSMKPYPFASLNHFTFPLAIARCLQRSESILRFVMLGTPLDVRRLYRNTLNFCQEIDGHPDEWCAMNSRQPSAFFACSRPRRGVT